MGGVKSIWRVIFIIILLHFHYFISLETANTQKSEVLFLKISSGNVNASVVTCQYPQIYNFSFGKEFLETVNVFSKDFDHKFYNTFCEEQPH